MHPVIGLFFAWVASACIACPGTNLGMTWGKGFDNLPAIDLAREITELLEHRRCRTIDYPTCHADHILCSLGFDGKLRDIISTQGIKMHIGQM